MHGWEVGEDLLVAKVVLFLRSFGWNRCDWVEWAGF